MGGHAGFDGVHKPGGQTTDPTPQFYYNQPGYQDLQGQPAPVAQGSSVGPMAPGAPLYCPPNQDGAPLFAEVDKAVVSHCDLAQRRSSGVTCSALCTVTSM